MSDSTALPDLARLSLADESTISSTERPANHSSFQSSSPTAERSIDESTEGPNSQPINQSTDNSTHQPANQPINQPTNQFTILAPTQAIVSLVHQTLTPHASFLLDLPAEVRNVIYEFLLTGLTRHDVVIRGAPS
jgi:hypothetical protein